MLEIPMFRGIFSSNKKTFSLLVVAILALSVPITLQLVHNQQDVRQRANATTLDDINPATGNTYEEDLVNNGAQAAVDFYESNMGGSVPQNVVEALNAIDSSGQVPESYGGSGSSGTGSPGQAEEVVTQSSSASIQSTSPQIDQKYIDDVNSVRTGGMTAAQFQAAHGSPPPAPPDPNQGGAGQYVVVGGGSAVGTGQYARAADGRTVWVPDSIPQYAKELTCGGTCTALPVAQPAAPTTTTPNVPPPVATTNTTGNAPAACAQFSQYCNSSGSCNWGTLPGTSACAQVVTNYYQSCLQASGNLAPTIQAICGSGTVPQPTTGGTTLTLSLSLPGIGTATGGNTNPRRPNRNTTVAILDASDNTVNNLSINFVYNPSSGNFVGTLSPATTPQSYKIKARFDNTTAKKPIQIFTGGTQSNTAIQLVSGDLDQDNSISLADYNLMLACTNNKSNCNSTIRDRADLNDDGTVDSADLAILYRGFQTRQGD